MKPNSCAHISTATTTHVATMSGVLHAISVNATAAGTITVADSLGTIAVLKASIAEGTYLFDVQFVGNLDVTTGAASDLTVAYTLG